MTLFVKKLLLVRLPYLLLIRRLRWFGHVERMDESRLTKKIYEADVGGNAGRGRPRRTFLD
jgi:hypothetical protein